MEKVYKAKSHISINVIMPNGKSRHLSFIPLTGGGSMLSTSDAELQSALECHHNFGVLFVLDKVVEEKPAEKKLEAKPKAEEPKANNVKVSSLEDAKAYLVDTFGISRTKLRSRKQIEEAGASHGVEFVFE